jgi:hypothetical protein
MVRDSLPAALLSSAPRRAARYELLTLGHKLGLTRYCSDRVLTVGDQIDLDGTTWVVHLLEPPGGETPTARLVCFERDAYADL